MNLETVKSKALHVKDLVTELVGNVRERFNRSNGHAADDADLSDTTDRTHAPAVDAKPEVKSAKVKSTKTARATTKAAPKAKASSAKASAPKAKATKTRANTSKSKSAQAPDDATLASLSRAELYTLACDLDVRGRKNMRKAQLIASIVELRDGTAS
jgi:hypothetical protein